MTRTPITKETIVRSVLATVFPHKELDALLSREVRTGMHPYLQALALSPDGNFDNTPLNELAQYLAPHMAPLHNTENSTRYVNAIMKTIRQGLIMFKGARMPYEFRSAYEVLEDDLYEFLLEPFDVFSEEDKEIFLLAASYGRKGVQDEPDSDKTPFELEQVSLNRHELVRFARAYQARLENKAE